LIKSSDDWANFVKEKLPNEFVIKPSKGAWGEDINLYTKTKTGLMDGFGKQQSEKDVYNNIMMHKKYDSFIVQERLKNHHGFYEISPSEYLHCVRIITLINSSGECNILHGQLNLVTGKNITSQGGNLKIMISVLDGCLEYGALINKAEGGFTRTTVNPETGHNFEGFKLPLWQDVRTISEKIAFKFLPLRTVGWDFAITEKGIRLIEANVWYGPPNFSRQRDKFIKHFIDEIEDQNQP